MRSRAVGVGLAVALLWTLVTMWRLFDVQHPPATVIQQEITLGVAGAFEELVETTVEQGFDKDEAVKLLLRRQPSGKKVMAELLAGNVDLGIVGLGPLVSATFEQQDFKIVASISTYYDLYRIVAATESGIAKIEDLRGKRIATTSDSSLHYFLHNFLINNNISPDDHPPVLVNEMGELLDLLSKKKVDAVVTREPFVSQAKAILQDRVVIFNSPDLPSNTLNLVVHNRYLEHNGPLVSAVLVALQHGADYLIAHPEEEQKLFVKGALRDGGSISMGRAHHELVLDQSLLLQLEGIARWSLRNKTNTQTEIPNFMHIVEPHLLKTLRPNAVTIIF